MTKAVFAVLCAALAVSGCYQAGETGGDDTSGDTGGATADSTGQDAVGGGSAGSGGEVGTSLDDGDTDNTAQAVDGLGDSCVDDDDCAGQGADHCALNPILARGYCTVSPCRGEACPRGYSCCDCARSVVLPQVEVCLTESDAALAAELGGCTCAVEEDLAGQSCLVDILGGMARLQGRCLSPGGYCEGGTIPGDLGDPQGDCQGALVCCIGTDECQRVDGALSGWDVGCTSSCGPIGFVAGCPNGQTCCFEPR